MNYGLYGNGEIEMNYPFDCITAFIFVENEKPTPPCDVILIPGGSHPQLIQRAIELYKKGMANYILVSGGENRKIPDYPSEAEYLKSIAIKEGVPSEAVLCEEIARNTYENAVYSYEIMKDKELDDKKVILVCKEYHSRRALFTFQKVFPVYTEFFVEPVTDIKGLSRDNWFTKDEYIKTVMGEVEKMAKYFSDDILPMYMRKA